MKLSSIWTGGLLAVAIAAQGQNTRANATPQTGSAAPAATGAASTGAQAAEAGATRSSATHGSPAAQASGQTGTRRGGQPQSGASAAQGGSRRSGDAPGITGVPRYRAGFHGRRGTPAAAATATVTATGDNDGSSPGANSSSAVLPGVPMMHNAFGIAKGTPIEVRLQQPVDSGHAKNGDMLRGVLAAPVGEIPAGAPVQLTVVAVAAAGQITSNGELSLQVVSVDGKRLLSDVVTAEGKEGNKLMPDDAPGRGTEAIFPANQPITLPAG